MQATLYVCTSVFNSRRYASRVRLYREFEHYVNSCPNTKLYTAEVAFGERPWEVTEASDPTDLQLRTYAEMWHKEKILNLLVQRLPTDWKYMAWVDSDVRFARHDWALEACQLLQHYPVIQLFSHALNLGPKYEPMNKVTGIIKGYRDGELPDTGLVSKYYGYFHPGFAWAFTREALNNLGGLIDISLGGSADWHMANALIARSNFPEGVSGAYVEHIERWRKRADRYVNQNVGYLPTLLTHYFHGKRVDRRYQDRWQILVRNNYNPDLDLKLDTQGLYQFNEKNTRLEQELGMYFAGRNEDSIDL